VNSGWQHETDGRSGWDQWLAQHAPKLLLFARQQARCEADACDLVQDAVVETWRQQSNGSPPPLGLVFTTIRRRAVDLARSENRRLNREVVAYQEAPQDWFDSGVEDRERSRLVQQAVSTLPEIQRDVITLKVWGGLTFAEIAEALDIPANTAASRYRYGLVELRKLTKEVFV
jgi:RNA polymerase sigma-70 factor, ECF subfamily